MANKDQPVQVAIIGGLLTISVGVSHLCHVLRQGPGFETSSEEEPVITDEDVFLRAVVAELEREEDGGDTRIHRMFDGAAEEAINQGAEGVWFPGG